MSVFNIEIRIGTEITRVVLFRVLFFLKKRERERERERERDRETERERVFGARSLSLLCSHPRQPPACCRAFGDLPLDICRAEAGAHCIAARSFAETADRERQKQRRCRRCPCRERDSTGCHGARCLRHRVEWRHICQESPAATEAAAAAPAAAAAAALGKPCSG